MCDAQVQGVDAALLYGQAVAGAFWRTVVMALWWASAAAVSFLMPLVLLLACCRSCKGIIPQICSSRGRCPTSNNAVHPMPPVPVVPVAVVATSTTQGSNDALTTPAAVPRRGKLYDSAHLSRFCTSPAYEEQGESGLMPCSAKHCCRYLQYGERPRPRPAAGRNSISRPALPLGVWVEHATCGASEWYKRLPTQTMG